MECTDFRYFKGHSTEYTFVHETLLNIYWAPVMWWLQKLAKKKTKNKKLAKVHHTTIAEKEKNTEIKISKMP